MQREVFCVFSGAGVMRLRTYLNSPRFHAHTETVVMDIMGRGDAGEDAVDDEFGDASEVLDYERV